MAPPVIIIIGPHSHNFASVSEAQAFLAAGKVMDKYEEGYADGLRARCDTVQTPDSPEPEPEQEVIVRDHRIFAHDRTAVRQKAIDELAWAIDNAKMHYDYSAVAAYVPYLLAIAAES